MSTMSELDLLTSRPAELGIAKRCGNCGTAETAGGTPVTTIVVDWRTELVCDTCVARQDWSEWDFDPVLNVYWRAR